MNSSRPAGRKTRRSLTSGQEFQTVYRAGSRHVSAVATIYVLPQEGAEVRLGIPTGRRLGGAVARNRLRRRIREAFGRLRPMISRGADIIIVPRAPAAVSGFDHLVRAIATAVEASGLKDGRGAGGAQARRRGSRPETP